MCRMAALSVALLVLLEAALPVVALSGSDVFLLSRRSLEESDDTHGRDGVEEEEAAAGYDDADLVDDGYGEANAEEGATEHPNHGISTGSLFSEAGLPISLAFAVSFACCLCAVFARLRDAERRRLKRHSQSGGQQQQGTGFNKVARNSRVSLDESSVEAPTRHGSRLKPRGGGQQEELSDDPEDPGGTYFDQLASEKIQDGKQEQEMLRQLAITPLQRDTVARAIIRSRVGKNDGDEIFTTGKYLYWGFLVLSCLVPACLGLMGVFGATDAEKKHYNRYLRLSALVLSITATTLQALEESGQYRKRGTAMIASCEEMKRLCSNYMQLTGPVFDPRNGSVEELNEGSLQIPDLTGIPIPMLEAHMETLREIAAEDTENELDHGGTNFKRFCMACTQGLVPRLPR